MIIKDIFNQYGLSIFSRLIKAGFRKIGIVYETFYLLKYSIDKIYINQLFNRSDYVDVTEIIEKDICRIGFIDEKKYLLFKERFKSGDYSCFAIEKDNEIQYLTWISWKKMNYPGFFGKSEVLKVNQALLEDSFCSPKYRGKGYHSKMNIFRMKKILDSGKSEVLALVLKENKPALKVQLKSGFNYYSRIRFIKIGKWNKTIQKLMK